MRAERVLWGEGLFLRPHHFQQQALYDEDALAEGLRRVRRFGWGLRRIALEGPVLRTGRVNASVLSLVFRDGTYYDAPSREVLPLSRDINELPQIGAETTLYACLPSLSLHGGNTASKPDDTPRPARYKTVRREVHDLYTRALEVEVTALELDVRLMFEKENRDGFDSIPVAHLVKNAAGDWEQDENFLPPMVAVSAAAYLPNLVQQLLDILLAKSAALAGARRERVKDVLGYGPADLASFWLLHTVNRNFALLNHLSKADPLPPEELYLALAGFCGELLTFSRTYTLKDLPRYEHENLSSVLPKLDSMIRELLDTVISARYAIIPLKVPKPSFHIGHLEERLVENVDYYLSVQGELPIARIVEDVPALFKIGSPDDVEKILHSAMRGVALAHMSQTPSALPVHAGNHYFAFETRGELFSRMVQSRSICIYMPESLAGLKLELIAAFR